VLRAQKGVQVMKKIVSLVMVGAMTFTLVIPAKAAVSPEANTYNYYTYNTYNNYNTDNSVTNNYNIRITVKGNGSAKVPKVTIKGGGGSSGGVTVKGNGNNTVSTAPGLDCVQTVGQGGKLIINGCKTKAVLSLFETTSGSVSSAKVLAASLGGTVKNVVNSQAPGVRFSEAQVNFYTPGVNATDIYRVYLLGANGTWEEIPVDEVRKDHIVVRIRKAGTLAFIKMN